MPNSFLTDVSKLKPNPEFWNNAPTGIGYHSATNLKEMADTIFTFKGVSDFSRFKIIGVDWDPVRRAAHVRHQATPSGFSGSRPKGLTPRPALDALTRVVAMRSRRMIDDDAHQSIAMDLNPSASVRPYPRDWREILEELFPQWFEHSELAVLDGWSDLLFAMCDQLSGLVDQNLDGFEFSQVKEKFGTLRAYHNGTPVIQKIVEAYERISTGICDVCGEPGRMRNDSGWYHVTCELHVKKDAI